MKLKSLILSCLCVLSISPNVSANLFDDRQSVEDKVFLRKIEKEIENFKFVHDVNDCGKVSVDDESMALVDILDIYNTGNVRIVSDISAGSCTQFFQNKNRDVLVCRVGHEFFLDREKMESYSVTQQVAMIERTLMDHYYENENISISEKNILAKSSLILRNEYMKAFKEVDESFYFRDDDLDIVNKAQYICGEKTSAGLHKNNLKFIKSGARLRGDSSISENIKHNIGLYLDNSKITGREVKLKNRVVLRNINLLANLTTLDGVRFYVNTDVDSPRWPSSDTVYLELEKSSFVKSKIKFNLQRRDRTYQNIPTYNGEFKNIISHSKFVNSDAIFEMDFGYIKNIYDFDIQNSVFRISNTEKEDENGSEFVFSEFRDVTIKNTQGTYGLEVKGSNITVEDITAIYKNIDIHQYVSLRLFGNNKLKNINFNGGNGDDFLYIYSIRVRPNTNLYDITSFYSERTSIIIGDKDDSVSLDGKNRNYYNPTTSKGFFRSIHNKIKSQKDLDKYLK